MFDSLSDKLQRVFKNLRGEGKLSAENMEAALKEIRVALLEADVHFKVVKAFIDAVRVKAMGAEVLASWLTGDPVPAPAALVDALDVARFTCRAVRRAARTPAQRGQLP